MRKMNIGISGVLIFLSVIGIACGIFFLHRENRLAAEQRTRTRQMARELAPIQEQRRQIKALDDEWQSRLEEAKWGKPCVILLFNTMNRELYSVIYDLMEQYGFHGTFVLQNGNLPGGNRSLISRGEVSALLNVGWDYAIAENVNAGKEGNNELATGEADTDWADMLDRHLASLGTMSRPSTLLCTESQYAKITNEYLIEREFKNVCVLNMTDFPTLAKPEGDVWLLDAGVYTENDSKVLNTLSAAVKTGRSMMICINEIVSESEAADYNLTVNKFQSLLTSLKALVDQEIMDVRTISEYRQYEEEILKGYRELEMQYAAFREEMDQKITELDEQEQAILSVWRERVLK